MKLLVLAGLAAGPWAVLIMGSLALLWSSIIGLAQTAINGQISTVVTNLSRLVRFKKLQISKLHRAPFAASLFLAAATQWIFFGGRP